MSGIYSRPFSDNRPVGNHNSIGYYCVTSNRDVLTNGNVIRNVNIGRHTLITVPVAVYICLVWVGDRGAVVLVVWDAVVVGVQLSFGSSFYNF